MTEPVFPDNAVSRVADFVKNANQRGQGSRLEPPQDHPNAQALLDAVAQGPPAIETVDVGKLTAAYREAAGPMPAPKPLSVDSIVFEDGKAHLVMTDGSSHELPEGMRQAAVGLALKAWELAMHARMSEFGEPFGVKIQHVEPEAPAGKPQNGPAGLVEGKSESPKVPKGGPRRRGQGGF